MEPQQLLDEAVEALEWIEGAGKERRMAMYADKIEKDYADEEINIWAIWAIYNAIKNIEGECLIIDLNTLIEEDYHQEDGHLDHPMPKMPLGLALAAMALISGEKPGGRFSTHENYAIRMVAASSTQDPELLDFLRFDPCMLVRTIVALNHSTGEISRRALGEDAFFHVQRRTLYGDSKALKEFDVRRDAIDKGSVKPEYEDFWPIDCNCIPHDYEDEVFEFFEEEKMTIPNIPPELEEKLRNFGGLNWATQTQPSPKDDYLLNSVEYLKQSIPDQFIISNWGHGLNSYSINLRIALGDLALIFQTGWGGVFMDRAEQLQRWNDLAGWADEMVQLKSRNYEEGFRKRKFLVVFSDFRIGAKPEVWVHEENTWQRQDDIDSLAHACRFVNQ